MSGTKNKIEDLRNHLFETLEALKDETKPMDLDRARAIADVAKKIIDSAKVEVDFLRVSGQVMGTGFIPPDPRLLPAAPERDVALPVTRRRIAAVSKPRDTGGIR